MLPGSTTSPRLVAAVLAGFAAKSAPSRRTNPQQARIFRLVDRMMTGGMADAFSVSVGRSASAVPWGCTTKTDGAAPQHHQVHGGRLSDLHEKQSVKWFMQDSKYACL